MIPHVLLSMTAVIGAAYAALLVTYYATCRVVLRLNAGATKIEPRQTPRSQIRRDQRRSVLMLLVIAVLFGCGHWTYATLGWGFRAWPGVSGMAMSFILSLVLYDTWFYWLHRLIHTELFYRKVHQRHHLTVPPVVWSNNNDRLVDNLLLQSYWLFAHFFFPAAPAVLVAHKLYDQVTGIIGHSGHEHGGRWCWPPSPLVGVTHHHQHHLYFRCNYANHFSWWDRAMGTLHPNHDSELKRNIAGRPTQ